MVENGFEDREFFYPYYRLTEAGYGVNIVGPKKGQVYHGEYGLSFKTDISVEEVNLDKFEVLLIPGGRAPDRMRLNKDLVNLTRNAFHKGLVVAAICHGAQLLIEAKVLKGKHATCYMSVATDIENAGAIFEDKSVVVDGNLVTSRFPADLPNFCQAILNVLKRTKDA